MDAETTYRKLLAFAPNLASRIAFDATTNCINWLGCKQRGYGRFGQDGQMHQAHRFAFEALIGPVPKGMVLDHLCRNRACMNPAHLEPVTMRENTLRGEGPSAIAARRSHCAAGHLLNAENTYLRKSGARECWVCKRAYRVKTIETQRVRRRADRAVAPSRQEGSTPADGALGRRDRSVHLNQGTEGER